MKQKFWNIFNNSEYAGTVIDFESDCIPTIDKSVFMSGGVMITLDSILIVTRKKIYEFKINELDGFKFHNKLLEKGVILHSWKDEIDIKINFNDERDRKYFFEQFQETFERLKLDFENEHGSIDDENGDDDYKEERNTHSKLPYEELKQLKELLEMGAITQDEFDIKKKELLNL